jgi:hypothetical protein
MKELRPLETPRQFSAQIGFQSDTTKREVNAQHEPGLDNTQEVSFCELGMENNHLIRISRMMQ